MMLSVCVKRDGEVDGDALRSTDGETEAGTSGMGVAGGRRAMDLESDARSRVVRTPSRAATVEVVFMPPAA